MSQRLLFTFLFALTLSAEPRVVYQKRIWDTGAHNAFTDLARHNNEWFCVFREGAGHVSPDGKIRIIKSKDGTNWTSAALVAKAERDLRDPHILRTPDGRLLLYGAEADRPQTPVTHRSLVWFSNNGSEWTEPTLVADKDVWLWRIAAGQGGFYGVGYDTSGEKFVRLYKSPDGLKFETLVANLHSEEQPNESGIVFEPDGTMLCLLRRDAKPGHGLFGVSKAPYTEWTWKDVGAKIGGPQMIRLPDNRFIAGVRLYDGGARTSVVEIDRQTGKLREILKLSSGGDTSYPGMVWHENELWMSYYSSHEGKTMIYLARISI